MNKIVSKILRQRMSADLGSMIQGLPVSGLTEIHGGNHVYMGRGYVEVGIRRLPVRVRVWVHEGSVLAGVRTDDRKVVVEAPFTTPQEREAFPETVRREMRLLWN